MGGAEINPRVWRNSGVDLVEGGEMSELNSKAEQIGQVLRRCSDIVGKGSVNGLKLEQHRTYKEMSRLNRQVTELRSQLASLKRYTRQLEHQINGLDRTGSTDEAAHQYQSTSPSEKEYFTDRNEEALFQVFKYLSTVELLRLQRVCKAWKRISQHPLLWQHLMLIDQPISHQALNRLSIYCSRTESIYFQGLMPAPTLPEEDLRAYISRQKASLEPGLDSVLSECGSTLRYLSLSECSLLFTERCLWLASKHCTNLLSLIYNSSDFPATPESLWSLANGCTGLRELYLMPSNDPEINGRFNDKCLSTIAVGFPTLVSLTVGGKSISIQGLAKIGTSLKCLQQLRVICGPPITVSGVSEHFSALCFKSLASFSLTNTRISPQAVVSFIDTHPNLSLIDLKVSFTDYFPQLDLSSTDVSKYERVITNLQNIANHFRYGSVFKLSHD